MKRICVGTIFVVMFIFSGCAMPQATKTSEAIDRLPDGEGLILDITQIGRQIGIYVVDADSGEIKEWHLQGPNLVKDGSKYCGGARTMSWSEADQQLFYAGWMACEHGFFQIHADGRVESMDLPSNVNGRLGDHGHVRSSDGEWIAWVDPAVNGADEHSENLHVFGAQTGRSEQITDFPAGYISFLSWNTAGEQLLFGHSKSIGRIDTLYRINRDGSDLTVLSDQLSGIPVIRMKWSPDGHAVAYSRSESGLPVTLHLLNLETGQDDELLPPHSSGNTNRSIRDFAWSPDGQRLVFAAGFDTTCVTGRLSGVEVCGDSLYLIDKDGDNLTRLTEIEQSTASQLIWLR